MAQCPACGYGRLSVVRKMVFRPEGIGHKRALDRSYSGSPVMPLSKLSKSRFLECQSCGLILKDTKANREDWNVADKEDE